MPGVQGADTQFEISVFNLLNVDFDFAKTVLCFNSYFVRGNVNRVHFHTLRSRLYYLLRRLNSSLLKVAWF